MVLTMRQNSQKMLTVAEAGRRGGKARLKKMSREERVRVAQLGVQARLKKLTADQRREVARKAAQARWQREKAKEA